jgi:hypothetical protein
LSQKCSVACSPSSRRYAYFIVFTLWLLQYIVFCLFWGRMVTLAVLRARDSVLATLKNKLDAAPGHSSKQGCATMWHAFAEAIGLPTCIRHVYGGGGSNSSGGGVKSDSFAGPTLAEKNFCPSAIPAGQSVMPTQKSPNLKAAAAVSRVTEPQWRKRPRWLSTSWRLRSYASDTHSSPPLPRVYYCNTLHDASRPLSALRFCHILAQVGCKHCSRIHRLLSRSRQRPWLLHKRR